MRPIHRKLSTKGLDCNLVTAVRYLLLDLWDSTKRLIQTRKTTALIHPNDCLFQHRAWCYCGTNEWGKRETPNPSSFSHQMLFRNQWGVLLYSDPTKVTDNIVWLQHRASVTFQCCHCSHMGRNTTVRCWHLKHARNNTLTEQIKLHRINYEVLLSESLRRTLLLTQPNHSSGISREPQPQGLQEQEGSLWWSGRWWE